MQDQRAGSTSNASTAPSATQAILSASVRSLLWGALAGVATWLATTIVIPVLCIVMALMIPPAAPFFIGVALLSIVASIFAPYVAGIGVAGVKAHTYYKEYQDEAAKFSISSGNGVKAVPLVPSEGHYRAPNDTMTVQTSPSVSTSRTSNVVESQPVTYN